MPNRIIDIVSIEVQEWLFDTRDSFEYYIKEMESLYPLSSSRIIANLKRRYGVGKLELIDNTLYYNNKKVERIGKMLMLLFPKAPMRDIDEKIDRIKAVKAVSRGLYYSDVVDVYRSKKIIGW